MKKLPKVYQNEINLKTKNNKEVYNSLNDNIVVENIFNEEKYLENDLTVYEKINKLINQNSYIFTKKVLLVFDNYEEYNQIAGVVNNHIITIDNKIIKIDELKDIKIIK